MAYNLQIESSSFAITSSFATTAATLLGSVTSASYAATASLLLGSVTSASFASTASFVLGTPTMRVDFAIPILAALVWTNMPVARSFWLSTATVAKNLTKTNLSNYNYVRLLVNKQGVAGAANSKLCLCYKTGDFTQTVADYTDISNPKIDIAVNVQNAFLSSSWNPITASAKDEIYLAVIGSGGNGAVDPVFGIVTAEFKQ